MVISFLCSVLRRFNGEAERGSQGRAVRISSRRCSGHRVGREARRECVRRLGKALARARWTCCVVSAGESGARPLGRVGAVPRSACRCPRLVVLAGSGYEVFLVRGWESGGARLVWLAHRRDRRCLVPGRVRMRVRAAEVLDVLYECTARR
jgi:hypothetical protein